ncbi:MAG TPA: cytochrome b N-terminal domain-containing protein [Candidatus Acidoferrales bacterium]|jgi:ubiquinol-cytochrome c reductase cytochrome b subunit|nr:cytochrome b N-terminal domain-containing protein [Candidatus Acidoferrales bacterium]
MNALKRIGEWLDKRLQVGGTIREVALHPVPRQTASWWYVFGSAAAVLFGLQVVTGILLALVYAPTGANAWNSLQVLDHSIRFGWFLRAMHGWGADFMVAVVLVHMCQVFLFGAYKYPRELTWTVGVFLLLVTLGLAFTGQVLRFDQDAYWGLGIGASITGRVPIIGGPLVHLLLGGPIIAGATLSRFFDLHVFILPGLLIGLVGLHLFLVLKLGINEWPMPGRLVRRETYLKEYDELVHKDGVPFVPYAIWKDLLFAAGVIAAVGVCAAVFGPFGPGGVPDPTIIQTAPRPDFFFLWIFALLALLPPQLETPFLLIAPIVIIGALVLLPFLAGEGEKSWKRRPVAVLSLLVIAVVFSAITRLGITSPWSPVMNAWSADPVPMTYLKGRSPLELQGALILQAKQCRNCHSLGGVGGMRGPALDNVATRLTENQLIRQVIQGGGNMPAYGKNLAPAEVTAVVKFLETLHQATQLPAKNASQKVISKAESGSERGQSQ